MIAKQSRHFLHFAQTHQAIVDKHAVQLIANRFMNQTGRHSRIDSARQSA